MKRYGIFAKGMSILLSTIMFASFTPVQAFADYIKISPATPEDERTLGDTDEAVYVSTKNYWENGGSIDDVDASVGNITSDGDDFGLRVDAQMGKDATVTTESITCTGDDGSGVELVNGAFDGGEPGGTIRLTVNGDVTGSNAGIVGVTGKNGTTEVVVNGNVSSDDVGITSYAGDGEVNVTVKGDVNAGGSGLAGTAEGGKIDVTVEGTISGKEVGVATIEGFQENFTVTAWAITPNENGWVAAYCDWESNMVKQAEDFEKNNISYIIRVDDNVAGATLSASAGIAKEGEKVLLRVDLQKGYEITGAYDDNGILQKYALCQDEDGNYYVLVPKGGGVLLSVSVNKKYLPPQPVDDDHSTVTAENPGEPVAASVEQMISNALPGATVRVTLTDGSSLNKMIIDALKARPDVTLMVDYIYNGVMYRAIIPAGTDLTPYLNAAGGIDFETLTIHFGGKQI